MFNLLRGETSNLAILNITKFAYNILNSEDGVYIPDLDEDDKDNFVKGFTRSRG